MILELALIWPVAAAVTSFVFLVMARGLTLPTWPELVGATGLCLLLMAVAGLFVPTERLAAADTRLLLIPCIIGAICTAVWQATR